jgi:hypothetical protein|tara:strand:- start:68 stop:196 length:129 start_codon:yes stop_codon:yes gene_type:complete
LILTRKLYYYFENFRKLYVGLILEMEGGMRVKTRKEIKLIIN